MKSTRSRMMVVTAFATALCLPVLAGAQQLAAPEAAPSASVAVLSVNDSKGLWTALSASPLRAPVEALAAEVEKAGDAGPGLSDLSAMLGFSLKPAELMTQTITGMDVHVLPSEAPGGEPEMLVAFKFADKARVAGILDSMAGAGKEGGPQVEELTVDGQGMRTFEVRTEGNPSFFVGGRGDVFVMSTGRNALNGASTATSGPAFLGTDAFRNTMTAFAGSPVHFWGYGDGTALSNILSNVADPQIAAATSGWRGKTMGFAGDAQSEFMRLRMFTPRDQMTPGARIAAENSAPGVPDALRFVPQGSLIAYSMANFGGKPAYDAMMTQMASDPNQAMAAMMIQMTLMQQTNQMGINMDTDLLGNMGRDMVFALTQADIMPAMMGGAPDVDAVIAIRMKDADKARATMRKIEEFVNTMTRQQFEASGMNVPADFTVFKDETVGGVGARVFGHPMLQDIPFTPTYAVLPDGYMVLTLQKNGFARAVSGADSIAKSPRLAKVSSMLGGNHPEVMAMDTKAIAGIARSLVNGPFGMAMEPDQRAGVEALTNLLDAMGGLYMTTHYSDAGEHTQFTMVY